jgi:deoxycytidine triphosphate deaminase
MILSDKDIQERIITDPTTVKNAMEWWDTDQWEKINGNLVIEPYQQRNLGVCSYDLSVGGEFISLRNPRVVQPLAPRGKLNVAAGETVLIMTKEYICLPKNVIGITVPRARRLFEGTSIAACRIEPTWYGCLIIAFTNFTKSNTWLLEGEPFCTCFFMETNEVNRTLKEMGVTDLGRRDLRDLTFEHLLPETMLTPEQVTLANLDQVVEEYGKPWDIIRGAFARTKDEIQNYIDEDTAPNITREATNNAVRHAYSGQQKLLWTLIGILGAALLGFIIHQWLP